MNVVQSWVADLPLMQQSVLLTAIRGPDGVRKYSPVKYLLRWFRRCVLLSAIDRRVLTEPFSDAGGSFTGPSFKLSCDDTYLSEAAGGDYDWRPQMDSIVGEYLQEVDAIPHHFQMHLLHAVEILGYKHPHRFIRNWWRGVYLRLVASLHLQPEPEADLDQRLGDSREQWLAYGDPATEK